MERSTPVLTGSDPDLSRFAVNLELWWSDRDQMARVACAAEVGFSWVELWFWPRWDVNDLARATRDLGLRVAQFGAWDFEPSLADRANHEQFEMAVRQAIDVAHRLDCGLINLNGPYVDATANHADAVQSVIEALRRVAPVLEAEDVTLLVEPMNTRVDHPGYSLPTSQSVIDVCSAAGSSNVKVNWDLYHLHISEGDLSGHLGDGFDYVGYIQIADHPGRHEPGTGEINYRYVLQRIVDLGYDGVIGLECSPKDDAHSAIERIKAVSLDLST